MTKNKRKTATPKQLQEMLLHNYTLQTVINYDKWIKESGGFLQEVDAGHDKNHGDLRASTLVCRCSPLDDGKQKQPLYPRNGKIEARMTPMTIKRRDGFVRQLQDLCQRMGWPNPLWSFLDQDSNHYRALVKIYNNKNTLLAECVDLLGEETKAPTREAVARLALLQFLDFDEDK